MGAVDRSVCIDCLDYTGRGTKEAATENGAETVSKWLEADFPGILATICSSGRTCRAECADPYDPWCTMGHYVGFCFMGIQSGTVFGIDVASWGYWQGANAAVLDASISLTQQRS